MSSLFNYELDENNIRSTLLKSEPLQFNPADWSDFEINHYKHQAKITSSQFIKLPEIHLNINRNVILPAFFILALVGVSAILLSFIDFKSDKEQVEKKLDPNADNYKPTTQQVVSSKPATVVKKNEPKPQPVLNAAVQNTVTNQVTAPATLQSNVLITNNDPAGIKAPDIASNNSINTDTGTNASKVSNPIVIQPAGTVINNQVVPQKIRRKRAEKVAPEQIETIKAPALLKTESESTEPEPDLEIKID